MTNRLSGRVKTFCLFCEDPERARNRVTWKVEGKDRLEETEESCRRRSGVRNVFVDIFKTLSRRE